MMLVLLPHDFKRGHHIDITAVADIANTTNYSAISDIADAAAVCYCCYCNMTSSRGTT